MLTPMSEDSQYNTMSLVAAIVGRSNAHVITPPCIYALPVSVVVAPVGHVAQTPVELPRPAANVVCAGYPTMDARWSEEAANHQLQLLLDPDGASRAATAPDPDKDPLQAPVSC